MAAQDRHGPSPAPDDPTACLVAALKASEEKYRSLYLNTPAMLHSIDRSGCLVSVSNHWLETMGYGWDEVIGRPSTDFLTPESRRYAAEIILPEYFQTGVCQDVPYQMVRKDGAIVEVLLSAIAERDAEGQVVRSLAVSVDVTERKRAEQEQERLRLLEAAARNEAEAAHQLDRLRRQFINAVSHELRTPLASVMGFTEFLEDELGGPLTPEQAEYVSQIRRGVKRLERLVNDLLDIAGLDSGTFRLRRETTDLAHLVRETAASLTPLAGESAQRLEIEVPDLSLPAAVDAQRIEQVLINLVGNAIKFTPRGGTIRVSMERSGDRTRCEVSDTGEGIAAEDVPKLFKAFSQLPGGASLGKGTGLGLSISRAIVEGHGGEIGVSSEPGRGSTFWFTLP